MASKANTTTLATTTKEEQMIMTTTTLSGIPTAIVSENQLANTLATSVIPNMIVLCEDIILHLKTDNGETSITIHDSLDNLSESEKIVDVLNDGNDGNDGRKNLIFDSKLLSELINAISSDVMFSKIVTYLTENFTYRDSDINDGNKFLKLFISLIGFYNEDLILNEIEQLDYSTVQQLMESDDPIMTFMSLVRPD